ncbi:MAG: NAD/NADP octopine/nopaline dehydrogenase family protein [Emcibacter sp.]|nr:NAD/NADP octopine/nopaline dehydrogenase family protein [Emcibacter sp.]
MKVTVIGGGHGSYAAAAELSEQGHEVCFWRRNKEAFSAVLTTKTVYIKDFKGERAVQIAHPTTDISEAISGADLIIIPLPATAHEALAQQVAPLFEEGQVVFLTPGTFGSYIFLKAMREAGNTADITFAETGTLPYLARKRTDDFVVVSGYAKRLPTGCLPARNSAKAFEIIKQAYPAIEPIEDALSGALMNGGPIIHPPLIMMNVGALEHFEKWDIHNEGTTPSIRRVQDALDGERIAIREALGYTAPHFPLANHYASEGEEWMYGRSAHEMIMDSGDWCEDIDPRSHRYVLEDIALGLSFLISMGKWADVATPMASGLLTLSSTISGRNFYDTGRTLENLGLDGLNNNQMTELLQSGHL